MKGWGIGIEQAWGNSYRCRGWGSPIDDDLRIGQSRHEFGVFVDDKLENVFRTDVDDVVSLIEIDARNYIKMQEQENPTAKYQLKKLQWVDC